VDCGNAGGEASAKAQVRARVSTVLGIWRSLFGEMVYADRRGTLKKRVGDFFTG